MKFLYQHKFLKITTALIFSLSISSCEEDAVQTLPERNWELTWSDEFDGVAGTLPDAAKWSYDIGTGSGGWGNQELQYYTNRPENVSLDGNGNLVITARKENYNGSAFTSARIKTKGLFDQQYGRFEARLKTPYGPGLWPAFWMLGSNIDTVPWPQCGEIDIMELRGQEPHIAHGTLHGPGYSAGNAITKAYALKDGRFDVDFHLFAVEWDADKIDFFVDNYLYQRLTRNEVEKKGQWVYNSPFFMILNVAVGGNYVGFPVDGTPFPQKMTIDYVRVYKPK
ncbi:MULTISPECIES: glycoside hydrolase family 16 protein [Chryseobacterium]|uniref:Beta-glucanase n=1 Tax=Chryseobacterium taihuense TaxID=1141221 RepID=A0A4U8WFC4_9FLAO|nr:MULTISPECIES: glycoside hydrolase family 16 protein [Chryseobacterium]QQV02669.1 glycoside hydrolase family 16 protein [Chryseobacterium sp. FDAARGOS 1104]VFB04070.1 Beta-glucanase precursor [Chryseobacterium taihuense]